MTEHEIISDTDGKDACVRRSPSLATQIGEDLPAAGSLPDPFKRLTTTP